MILDDGILYLCELNDTAEPGDMPHEELVKVARHWYGERSIAISRQYLAKGVSEQVDLLARIHYDKRAVIGMYALRGDGAQFRITAINPMESDENNLKYMDLTLMRLEEFYDVAEQIENTP